MQKEDGIKQPDMVPVLKTAVAQVLRKLDPFHAEQLQYC